MKTTRESCGGWHKLLHVAPCSKSVRVATCTCINSSSIHVHVESSSSASWSAGRCGLRSTRTCTYMYRTSLVRTCSADEHLCPSQRNRRGPERASDTQHNQRTKMPTSRSHREPPEEGRAKHKKQEFCNAPCHARRYDVLLKESLSNSSKL